MIRAELRGLFGRKLRTILTAVAIILGVAMVSGTFVLTDSIDKAFNSIFTDSRKGSDAVITGKAATSTNNGSNAPTVPESLLAKVQALPDVEAARGERRRRRAPDRLERQGDRLRRSAEPRLQHPGRRLAVQPAHARRGRLAPRR